MKVVILNKYDDRKSKVEWICSINNLSITCIICSSYTSIFKRVHLQHLLRTSKHIIVYLMKPLL